jgi:hypothetical protein
MLTFDREMVPGTAIAAALELQHAMRVDTHKGIKP